MRLVSLSCLAFLVLLLSPLASAAIGVSPSSYQVDFKPGLTEVFPFEFYVDDGAKLDLSAEGDLANYTELSAKRISGKEGVSVLLKLPQSIETPGAHTIYITGKQVADEENGFGIIGNIKGLIVVRVPYPGQYATIGIGTTSAKTGEPVNISIHIQNLGKEAVKATGEVKIYRNDTFIKDISIGDFDLESPSDVYTTKYLDTKNFAPGTYRAVAQLWYGDSNLAQSESAFRLGELMISITNYTREFQRDKINRIEIEVESNWNDPIEGIFANVTLQGYRISMLTPSATINGFDKTTLTGFFDTTGITNDTFTGIIKVNYAGKSTEQLATFTFKEQVDYMMIGLIIAAAVVIILLIFITYVLRRVEKRKK